MARELSHVNLDADLEQYAKPMDLFSDDGVEHFRYRSEAERAKGLVSYALICSAMINFALSVSQRQGITPLADAVPYQGLLGAKYARAARTLENTDSKIQLTDLSFAIFDEILPAERLEKLTFKEIFAYRRETGAAREAFLEHLAALRAKQGIVSKEGDYSGAIKDILATR